ncbi:FAD-binding oxidoreductase [Nocardioides currus]|uniref:FAD-binding oxidoreductase n=1 Tax=Nocardioides currus TaxID=2133958 RepID=A0A2R7Z250_9ACTN|nr:FAD-linked oxidase C-terminal domain-containing protein [Nocardioides currus]PUA82634.1 FAD-binding oxidoreductase [Nocardioides currus]
MGPATTGILDDLAAGLTGGRLVVAEASLEAYRHDFVPDPDAGRPLAAALVTSVEEVRHCLRWATRHRVPMVPRGAGTGLSGGATAVDGCLVLVLDAMTAISIDPTARVATVEPGALNIAVKEAAAAHGLHYPPDPGSFRISTIGGNIATNAGGLCCVKYGVTAAYVLGLDIVLADGRLLELGGSTIKDVAGLPLLPLFVGSEGTLGVVVGARLRLVPQPPPAATVVAVFSTTRAAGEAVVAIGRTCTPSLLELLDNRTINNVEDYRPSGLDRTAGALLIAQSDARGAAAAAEAETIAELCRAAGADEVHVSDDPEEGEALVEVRRMTGPAVEVRGALLPEDVGVPVDRLPDLLTAIEAVAAELDVEIPVVAHAGDGNVHPTIVYDPADVAMVARARVAFERILALALELDGTITGEHGVGRAKRSALAAQVGDDVLEVSRGIKAVLDPLGLLNPGVLL